MFELISRVVRTLEDEGYSDAEIEASFVPGDVTVEHFPPVLGTFSSKGPKVDWVHIVQENPDA